MYILHLALKMMFNRDNVVAVGPCAMYNGGCNHICWTSSSTTRLCDCAVGFQIDSDGATCTSRKSHSSRHSLTVCQLASISYHVVYDRVVVSTRKSPIIDSVCIRNVIHFNKPITLLGENGITEAGIKGLCIGEIIN